MTGLREHGGLGHKHPTTPSTQDFGLAGYIAERVRDIDPNKALTVGGALATLAVANSRARLPIRLLGVGATGFAGLLGASEVYNAARAERSAKEAGLIRLAEIIEREY